jgi:hypothetical protein
MDFDYSASGKLQLAGDAIELSSYYGYVSGGKLSIKRCGNNIFYFPKHLIILSFMEGDIAWLRYEANRGKIRNVRIKRVKITNSILTLGKPTIIYYDNLNAIFNEDDLVTHDIAVSLAISYHQRRLYEAQKAIECL